MRLSLVSMDNRMPVARMAGLPVMEDMEDMGDMGDMEGMAHPEAVWVLVADRFMSPTYGLHISCSHKLLTARIAPLHCWLAGPKGSLPPGW